MTITEILFRKAEAMMLTARQVTGLQPIFTTLQIRTLPVIIETDAKTRPAGSDGDYSETNQKVYTDNGMYIFNMEKSNMLSASYGVDLRIIDKTPLLLTFWEITS